MHTSPILASAHFSSSPHAEASSPRPSLHRASTEATERSRPKFRAAPLDHRPANVMPTAAVTPEEYDSLPPSIQKKYFSSVERLRIAQQSAALKRKKQQQQAPTLLKEACLSPRPSQDSMRPKTAHTFKSSPLAQPRKSLSSRTARSDADVDEQQAVRFLALPDKVKRSHFTQEELILLTESSERALCWPPAISDDQSSRRTTFDRKASVCSSTFRSSVSGNRHDDMEKDWLEIEAESIHSSEGRQSQDAELAKYNQSKRNGSVSSSFSALPPLPSGKDEVRPSVPRKPYTRKRFAPIPLPPPTLLPAVPPLHSSKSVSSFPVEHTYSPTVSTTEPTPSTKYYKDSQARQKLREYLASPEKFDEALEFGFPTEHQFPPQRSTSLHSNAEPGLQLDVESDCGSEAGSKDDEDRASLRSPRTPSVVNECFSEPVGTYSSQDSGVALPYHLTPVNTSTRSLSPDFHGREMTLRMTLTRSDLRAPEKELYSFQRTQVSGVDVETSDPLALEALPFCDDHTGAHGAFAVTKPSSGGGFKRVWKNFRGR